MSHVKNVEAFGKLIGICTGLGETYTPGQQKLSLVSLNAMLLNARQALGNVQESTKDLANITNAREEAFKNMRTLVSRVVNEFKFSGVAEQNQADVRSVWRKLAGHRISRDPIAPEEAKVHTRSHRSRGHDFITQVETFTMLIKLVGSEPKYRPGNEVLSIASLQAVAEELHDYNVKVTAAYSAMSTARRHRNEILYGRSENMIGLSRSVKLILRSTFGMQAEVYRMVSKISINPPTLV